MEIEYRIRPVTRYIVTRCATEDAGAREVSQIGEYYNAELAYHVSYAMAKAEHEKLGWPLDDPRMKYPEPFQPSQPTDETPEVPALA